MNLLGMRRAAVLRRSDTSAFEVAVRVRPEGKEVAYGRLSELELHGLWVWQCIALVSHGPATSWRNEALLQIHPCDPVDSLVQPTQDNCFFAPPSVMDLVLRSLGDARSAEAAAEGVV